MTEAGPRRGTGLAAVLREDQRILPVVVLFFVLGAVWLGSPAHYHGDERYYTDAALRMIERHDPWTPVYAGGAARLNKPLLTYWLLLGTYATAGVSLFLSRLPFLIAGTALVWLTGRLARVLFPSERAIAALAACIIASDVEIVTLARRSTPDILLALAATATLYGVARILVAREAGSGPRAWLWIGAGVAVATKGGLGLVVIVFALVAALAVRGPDGERVRVRDLFSPWPVILGVAIALAGLLPGFLATAPATGPTMFQDQVSARIVDSPAAALKQASNYVVSLLKHFGPWVLLAGVALFTARGELAKSWRRNGRAFRLVIAWTLVLLVVFSLANTHRGRYLVPAHPMLACAFAVWMHDATSKPPVRIVARVLVGVLVAVSLVAGLSLLRVDKSTAWSVLAVALAVGVGWILATHYQRELRALAIGLLAASAVAAEGVRALVDPSPVPAACARMVSAGIESRRTATVGIFESTASQMRVVSHARLDPTVLPAGASEADMQAFDAVLAVAAARPALERAGLNVEVVSRTAPDLTLRDAWKWLTSADPRAWLQERGEPVLLAIRPGSR